MASNNKSSLAPEVRDALNKFKMEAASEVAVNLEQGYNGDLTSKKAGSVGGQMVNIISVLTLYGKTAILKGIRRLLHTM